MIGTWITSILKASRSATAAAVTPKMKALEQAGETRTAGNHPGLPGMRGRALRMEAIMPWPNLAVSRAVVTGAYEMNLARTRRGDLSLVLNVTARPVHKARAKIVVHGGRRPEVLARTERGLHRVLTWFIMDKAPSSFPKSTAPAS